MQFLALSTPLFIGAGMKIAYDVMLYRRFAASSRRRSGRITQCGHVIDIWSAPTLSLCRLTGMTNRCAKFPLTVSRMRPGDRATATSLQAHAGEPAKGKGY